MTPTKIRLLVAFLAALSVPLLTPTPAAAWWYHRDPRRARGLRLASRRRGRRSAAGCRRAAPGRVCVPVSRHWSRLDTAALERPLLGTGTLGLAAS